MDHCRPTIEHSKRQTRKPHEKSNTAQRALHKSMNVLIAYVRSVTSSHCISWPRPAQAKKLHTHACACVHRAHVRASVRVLQCECVPQSSRVHVHARSFMQPSGANTSSASHGHFVRVTEN
eukprot:6207090-Pleurochrysis_carterae.AAC.3